MFDFVCCRNENQIHNLILNCCSCINNEVTDHEQNFQLDRSIYVTVLALDIYSTNCIDCIRGQRIDHFALPPLCILFILNKAISQSTGWRMRMLVAHITLLVRWILSHSTRKFCENYWKLSNMICEEMSQRDLLKYQTKVSR